ncbi:Oxysterol-binding protein-like protein 1 [Schizosaccharomyces pombe 972h-] [Rhizoctonia solani]|uniref:Oxysterol-binding protein-like protein 1 [Schizosaccharomyces pombe 972h-] n=1 Tax=Rhizoctonia solani TaxID=456999 RepID=A0A0K6GAJ6_9AGAM|nr:Oxysterol-binding protein-like protein 1 [Schizosaccharomyces pombe 972h-] [Rhizoctonia solani]
MGKTSGEAERKEYDARDASSLSLPAGANDAAEPVADSGEGKLKMIVGLVKKCLGVKDIATMRISLPASLLEPIPNLEYWNYLDRPDVFAAINDSNDSLMRMVAVLRFTFTKDLKFVHGKICKPYNSVLGEYFRSHTSFTPLTYPADPNEPPVFPPHTLTSHNSSLAPPDQVPSETASVRSTTSTTAGLNGATEGTDANEMEGSAADDDRVRVVFLTEQVSHHPPISSFYITAPERGIEACGVDQISAKVVGTSVRVTPGSSNQGIFINLTKGPGSGEKYRITHNSANVNGVLRGQFYATMSDSTIITCERPGKDSLRAVIEYKEESWIGRSQFLVEGVIHTCNPSDPDECASWTKVKSVPQSRVVATFDGTWRGLIKWKRAGSSDTHTLVDLSTLAVLPKRVRPVEEQLPNESHRLWEHVTKNLLSKNYSEATRVKQNIEQKQRDDAAARKSKNEEFVPVYFEPDISNGQPVLTAEGRKAVEEELALASALPIS